jgi:hypothetical protein
MLGTWSESAVEEASYMDIQQGRKIPSSTVPSPVRQLQGADRCVNVRSFLSIEAAREETY